MIRTLKIQKGLVVIILGVIAIITYSIMIMNEYPNSRYALWFSGILFILGSLMLLYPILSAKKDKDGAIELDKEVAAVENKDKQGDQA